MHRLAVVLALVGCSQKRPEEPAPAGGGSTVARATPDAAPPVLVSIGTDAPPTVPRPKIVDKPMVWTAERERLTLDYRKEHSDPAAKDVDITPRVVVLHYTAGPTAKSTLDYFDNIRIEAERRDVLAAGAVNVSSHYVIDRDGTIYQIQPDTRFARHCIGLNHISIGIENAGDGDVGAKVKFPLTDAQVAANIALVRYLASRYPITHVVGHSEMPKFRDHPYYLERDAKYFGYKSDPGAVFLARVREGIADMKLSDAEGRP